MSAAVRKADAIRVCFLVGLSVASFATSAAPARGAAAAPGRLIAQILEPLPGFKLRASETLAVRVRVEGANAPGLAWSLSLRRAGTGEARTLAAGMEAVPDAVVTELAADELSPGNDYVLALVVTDVSESATAETSFRLPDPLYAVIPLDEGNLSRLAYETYGSDAAGDLLLYAGRYAYPAEMILFDRRSGRKERVLLLTASNEGVKLSGDGSRLFFSGSFQLPGNTYELGLGYLDLQTKALSLIAPEGSSLYSTDRAGRRTTYEGLTAARATQYFLYDEASKATRQVTNDPSAIIFSPDPAFCPQPSATIPLVDADGSTVVVITSATLGLGVEDASAGCRVFRYTIDTRTWEQVASLPRSKVVGPTALSADGHWLSLLISRQLPNSVVRGFPGLMDLQTGELRDPVVDVGDFTSFDSVITGDGRGVVISTEADLDARVGNADHNMELFYFDLVTGALTQITETSGGIAQHPGGCPSYRPYVSTDAAVVTFFFPRFSTELCALDGPQRNEGDGFVFRFVHAVRKRPVNRGPVLQTIPDQRVVAGDTLALDFTAQDADGDPISFFAQVKDGDDIPPGSEITDYHDGTATFTWPTRPEQVGIYVLRVAAFDEGGGEVFHDLTIAVVPRDAVDVTPTPTATATPNPTVSASPGGRCVGDCNGDRRVSVSELVTGLDIALGVTSLDACPAVACHDSAPVTVDCITAAVAASLRGCPQ